METDLPKTGETPSRSGLPSFVEVGQTESGAPSLGYKPGTRPRVVYANNPASPIGHKTAAIKQFEQQESERLREQASNEGLPVKKQKRSKSSTPRLSGEAQQQLRAAVDARVQADEEQRLRAEFGDVPADLLPKNIKSPELRSELLIPDRTGTDTFHAETRLVYEGCDHVTVSGPPSVTTNEQNRPSFTFGKQYNCVLCSLYRMNHGLPYSFHTDKVKSWFLPEPLGVAEFFGAEIAAVASSPEFVQEFKTKEPFDAQDLINILADKNMPWPKLTRGQKELS